MQPMLSIALRAARRVNDLIFRAIEYLHKRKEQDKYNYILDIQNTITQQIINTLHKAYPNHKIIGDKDKNNTKHLPNNDYIWLVNSIDGTINYINSLPHFAISIACKYKGRLEHAVVLDPIRQEEFTASRGSGATLNGKRVRVSNKNNLEGALICTGFPVSYTSSNIDMYIKIWKSLAKKTSCIRNMGSTNLDLAYVAAGRFDAYLQFGVFAYEMAAGVLLVQEAGGLVSDFTGNNNFFKTGQIIAGNNKCFKNVLNSIKPIINC